MWPICLAGGGNETLRANISNSPRVSPHIRQLRLTTCVFPWASSSSRRSMGRRKAAASHYARNGFILGYGGTTLQEIPNTVRKIRTLLNP